MRKAFTAVLVMAALGGVAAAGEAGSDPAEDEDTTTQEVPTTQPFGPRIIAGSDLKLKDLQALNEETKVYAMWACIFSGLALVGVLWVILSMRGLARNQVELGRMVQALKPKEPE